MIPKLIHHIWLGTRQLNDHARFCIDSWKALHPSWEFMMWSDSNLPPLLNQTIFDGTIVSAQRADLLRYELMLQCGGLYVDVDFECLKPIDALLHGNCFVYGDELPGRPAIGLLASPPGHSFAKYCVTKVSAGWPWAGNIVRETGPVFFKRTILQYLAVHHITPIFDPERGRHMGNVLASEGKHPLLALYPWVIYPYYMGGVWHQGRHPDAYAVHHWHGSWH